MKTAGEYSRNWLEAYGYDGLLSVEICNGGDGCGCELCDLIPCGEPENECMPGFRGPDLEYGGEWAMYATKEAAEAARQKPSGPAT